MRMLRSEKKQKLGYLLSAFEQRPAFYLGQWIVDNHFVCEDVLPSTPNERYRVQDHFCAGYLLIKEKDVDWEEKIIHYARELARTPFTKSKVTSNFYHKYIAFMMHNYTVRTLPPFSMLTLGRVFAAYKYAVLRADLINKKICFSDQTEFVKEPYLRSNYTVNVGVDGIAVIDLEKYAQIVLASAIAYTDEVDRKFFRFNTADKRIRLIEDIGFIHEAVRLLVNLTQNAHLFAYSGPFFNFDGNNFFRSKQAGSILPAPSAMPPLGVLSASDYASYAHLADFLDEHVCKQGILEEVVTSTYHSTPYAENVKSIFLIDNYDFSFVEQSLSSEETNDTKKLLRLFTWRSLFGKTLINIDLGFFNLDFFLDYFGDFVPYLEHFAIKEEKVLGRKVNNCIVISLSDVYSLLIEHFIRKGGWVRIKQ